MGDWLEYDWTVRGIPAQFQTDASYYENHPKSHNTLLWLSVASRKPNHALNMLELRRADGFLRKAEKQMSAAVYVGCICLPAQCQYYFYTAKKENIAVLEKLAQGEKRLFLTAGQAEEPTWQTYYQLLYPDTPKFQTIENEKRIELLKKQGDNPEMNRRIRLNLFFLTEPLRLQFQEEARKSGFAIGNPIFAPEQELSYGIEVYSVSSLIKPEIDALTTRAIREAEKHGGMLFGWDCPLIPKKHPLR